MAINPDVVLHWDAAKNHGPFDAGKYKASSSKRVVFRMQPCFIHTTKMSISNVHKKGSACLRCRICNAHSVKSRYETVLRSAAALRCGAQFRVEVKELAFGVLLRASSWWAIPLQEAVCTVGANCASCNGNW